MVGCWVVVLDCVCSFWVVLGLVVVCGLVGCWVVGIV